MSEAELDELRSRLADAEEALRAIRAGELDALVIPGPKQEQQVYSLASAERPYRLMIEQMQEGAVTTSLRTTAILYCNRSFARMLGAAPEALVGRRLEEMLAPTDGAAVSELLLESQPHRGDFELVGAAGARLPVSISATSVVGEGPPTRCLIVSDQREQRDNEHLRRVRRELENANRRKNEFIAMLGHELRNPLAPIRQAVELLQSRASDPKSGRPHRALRVIERQVEHMTRLIDDLLDAGRITKGTLNVEPRQIRLHEVIDAAVESVRRLLDLRQHRFAMCVPARSTTVTADPVRLTQVVANLLSNAAKYTPEGGRIELGAELVGKEVRICVRDTGQGIPADLLPQLFDPFVQGAASLDRASGGLGVGLALVKRLVELHGGRVEAHSDGPGAGSEFVVHLPVVSEPAPRHEVEPHVTSNGGSARRILVVDDNEDAADMMALVLRGRGHDVELAFDGPSALRRAAQFGPTVVCLDIGLPGMDGFEVARRLRAGPTGWDLVVLAVTGYGQEADRDRAEEAGFDALLVKPVTAEALEREIARARPTAPNAPSDRS